MQKIIVCDYTYFVHQSIYSRNNALVRKEELSLTNPEEASKMFIPPSTYTCLSSLLGALKKVGINEEVNDIVILAVDSRHSWRKEIDQTYKGKRKEQREQAEKVNWDKEYQAHNELLDKIDHNLPFWVVKGENCLLGNTFIACERKNKCIKDINKRDKVITYNFKNNRFELNKVEKLFKNKYNAYYKLEFFDSNKHICMTANHKIYTQRGWIKTKNLEVRDIIYTKEDYNLLQDKNNLFMLGYLAGFTAGDGYLFINDKTYAYRLMFDITDIEPLKYIQKIVKKIFGKYYLISHRKPRKEGWKETYQFRIHGMARIKFVKQLIENPPKDDNFKKGFMSGFYDAEGTKLKKYKFGIIRITNTNKKLINYCVDILNYFDIHYKRYYFKSEPIYAIDINKQLMVKKFFQKFYPKIKRKTLSTLKNGLAIRRIEYIKDFSPNYFYNLETKNHNYFANGLLVHNCEADDIIATIPRFFNDKQITIISPDKDFLQLLTLDNVRIWSPHPHPSVKKCPYRILDLDREKEKQKAYKELMKKIRKETSDDLVSEVSTSDDYDKRRSIIDLLKLPDFVLERLKLQLSKISTTEKICFNPSAFSKGIKKKLEGLYSTDSIILYDDCYKKLARKLTKKKKLRKEAIKK